MTLTPFTAAQCLIFITSSKIQLQLVGKRALLPVSGVCQHRSSVPAIVYDATSELAGQSVTLPVVPAGHMCLG